MLTQESARSAPFLTLNSVLLPTSVLVCEHHTAFSAELSCLGSLGAQVAHS